jgi:large subunit ribosomal protein L24
MNKRPNTALKKGDIVVVIAGGNKTTRPNKGKVGRILGFAGKNNDRVIVEGVNLVKRHQKQGLPNKPHGIIQKEAGIHISNVMYYVEKLKKPVRLKASFLADGKKVRGYINPETKAFEQID